MFWFRLRMYLLIALMFSIVYAIVYMIAYALGLRNIYFYMALSLAMLVLQYMLGPKLIEWSMRVRYLKPGELPEIQSMVKSLAISAGIPIPRVGVSEIPLPNAFAFGRWKSDGRVCVTEGILKLLNEKELKAVLGHEITHIKNRDVLTITLLSVIPLILYQLAWQMFYMGGGRSRREASLPVWAIGLIAFLAYFITNLLVLYASRIREYFADRGSVALGNPANELASALYKLVYGATRTSREAVHQVEGLKAFFVNDPSCALKEFKELKELDTNFSGTIDAAELSLLRNKTVRLSTSEKFLEIFSTHPNMLKRIKKLSDWQYGGANEH
ncbi:MAG: zinc metalloprotease HtpX [Candidatus Omnitrophica bacterium]|nr:zinc metalloprotease HtpX [Candidatus Omnitrophota bacterium]MDD5236398.1 zinc metalloprotease HtpX [Candidatus Omnitrophota bacterium]MDD5611013.1 zinc metalloprotease HtpX [Candidatus Omnitrophota bacterium]